MFSARFNKHCAADPSPLGKIARHQAQRTLDLIQS
jgi:hypothetical protein